MRDPKEDMPATSAVIHDLLARGFPMTVILEGLRRGAAEAAREIAAEILAKENDRG